MFDVFGLKKQKMAALWLTSHRADALQMRPPRLFPYQKREADSLPYVFCNQKSPCSENFTPQTEIQKTLRPRRLPTFRIRTDRYKHR